MDYAILGFVLVVVVIVGAIAHEANARKFREFVRAEIEKELTPTRKELNDLRAAFDAWFDLVAPELGFEAKQYYNEFLRWNYAVSPRAAAELVTRSIVKRISPKICATRKAGK